MIVDVKQEGRPASTQEEPMQESPFQEQSLQ